MKVKTSCFTLWLVIAWTFAAAQDTPQVTIRGAAETGEGEPVPGIKFHFLLAGSPKINEAVTGADGKYSLAVAPGEYEIRVVLPGAARPFSGNAWLGGREQIELNARIPKGRTDVHAEYDFLGEWKITDEKGRGLGPARVTVEGLLVNGKRSRFPVYVPVAEDEREMPDGKMESSPDGRFIFRIRESHLLPERVTALVLSAEMPGYARNSMQVFPALQFSDSGHLFAAYADEVTLVLKKQ